MDKTIRIGTLSSEIALWQANIVAKQLEHLDYQTEIVQVDTLSKEALKRPSKASTDHGLLKKTDAALFNDHIDIAVQSLANTPAALPEEIVQVAVLKRGNFNDVLVLRTNEDFFANKTATIATDSLRCKSQWLYRYPNHQVVEITGSIKERLEKLKESNWDGAIFSMAALHRINLLPDDPFKLGWMIPAPAEGTVMISALKNNSEIVNCVRELNDKETELCTSIEREFLNELKEDYTAPVGALATIKEETLKFRAAVFSPDGKDKLEFSKEVPANHTTDIAQFAAQYILNRNGKKIMRQVLEIEKKIQIFSTKNLSITQRTVLNSDIGITMSDFITIQYNRLKPMLVKKNIENVVITSQSAAASLLHSFDKSEMDFTHIYCVGRRTKRLIEKNIGKVTQVENTSEKLANYLVKNLSNKEITYFCGNNQSDELTNILLKNNITVHEIEAYKTVFSPIKIDHKYKGVLFYSPAEIKSYLKENAPADIAVFCNGQATATEAKKYFKNIIIAKMPTAESILKSVNEYFQEK